jgi:Asp-tRNA(Asn)/Glu-tRNA(Gln) amidotransferase A subunit family amidase
MFTTALEEARQLDEEHKVTGKLRGPLHGVPISFKDQFEIVGKDASIGFSR